VEPFQAIITIPTLKVKGFQHRDIGIIEEPVTYTPSLCKVKTVFLDSAVVQLWLESGGGGGDWGKRI
jgi:hypothetical protein